MRLRERRFDPGDPDAGFTLIEALVAMTVLALLAAVLLRGVVALRSDAAAVSDDMARGAIARAVLDGALRDRTLHDGTYTGLRDGWPWTLVATRADLGAQIKRPPSNGTPAPPSKWRPQRLVVTVGAQRAVALETLRLAAP